MRDVADAIFRAARDRDIGGVVRLSRQARKLTQRQLADLCKCSQSTVSRVEANSQVLSICALREMAARLSIPSSLLGLADSCSGEHQGELSPERRELLGVASALAASAVLPESGDDDVASIRSITFTQRRLDGTTPSRELVASVIAHLSLATYKHSRSESGQARRSIAAATSEVAGLAAWLHWDMHDLGSARGYYNTAIRAANSTGDQALYGYMLGSMATLAVYEGDAAEGLALLRRAADRLGPDRPAIAVAWLCALEALAHADTGNERAAWRALDRAEAAVARIGSDGAVRWPWVFQFDQAKIVRHRFICAVRLRQPGFAFKMVGDVDSFLRLGHAKQRGLLQLDVADAYLQAGEFEEAFRVAGKAVELGQQLRSGRIIDRARRFRRDYGGSPTGAIVRNFDDRLQAIIF